jgi:predicted metal-dependent hydrolase
MCKQYVRRRCEVPGMDVELLRSKRARKWRIELTPRGPRMIVPLRMPRREVELVLERHRAWIERELAQRVHVLGLERSGLSEGDGRTLVAQRAAEIATREAAALAVTFKRIVVRDQRTRWGSCSTTGTLSFNWRLALAPPGVLDYIVVHEICHLLEHNHGPRFWALVQERRPGYRDQADWLGRHGHELQAYRPPLDSAPQARLFYAA